MNIKNRDEVYKFFITEKNGPSKSKKDWLIKYHYDVYEIIENNCSDNITFLEKIWLYIHNLNEVPTCLVCKNKCKFSGKLKHGYRTYCSVECRNKSKFVVEKRKNAFINKYGSSDVFHVKSIINKIQILTEITYNINCI